MSNYTVDESYIYGSYELAGGSIHRMIITIYMITLDHNLEDFILRGNL